MKLTLIIQAYLMNLVVKVLAKPFKAVVEHARENNLKIIASCSFAKHMLEKRRFISRCISWLNKFCDGATVPSLFFCSHQYKIAKRLVILRFKLYAINSFSFLVYFFILTYRKNRKRGDA